MPELGHKWEPIADLPEDWAELQREDLVLIRREWQQEKSILKDPVKIQQFHDRLSREWAIETGIIERLYVLDRGITETLIELGLDNLDQLHRTGQISVDAAELIQDQQLTLELVFDFVRQERAFTDSYIKQLHQALTQHQDTSEAVDQFGKHFQAALLKGAWKILPNNPIRADGLVHEYCPPGFVQDEIDQLLSWHEEHRSNGVPTEVEAAWLHHRFTEIHPFQDGNGRVARALATLIFLRDDYLPLVIRDTEHRDAYLTALSSADNGDLKPLVNLVADIQIQDLHNANDFLRTLRGEGVARIVVSATERAKLRREKTEQDTKELTEQLSTIARYRLEEVREELTQQFRREGIALNAVVIYSLPGDGKDHYWGGQIVDIAKQHRYWADLSKFRTWADLRLRIPHLEDTDTHLVITFHHKGTTAGLMVANAFVSVSRTAEAEEGWEMTPTAEQPYTYSTTHRFPERGFREWLEKTIEATLDVWQSRI